MLADLARPGTSHDWTLLGTALLEAGDPAAAEDALRRALRLECTSFWAWFMVGHCHFAQARYAEAAGDFSACTALGPQFAWAHFNRASPWPGPDCWIPPAMPTTRRFGSTPTSPRPW